MTSNNNFTMLLRSVILGSPRERTITVAANMLRIGRPALSNVLNGNAELSVELAARIEDVFRYSALDLLYKQAEAKLNEYRDGTGSAILPTCISPSLFATTVSKGE